MRASGRVSGRLAWSLVASILVLGFGVAPTSWASEPLKVVMEFDGSGTFSATNGAGTETPEHADVQLKWSTTYVGELQPDGSIAFQATGASATGEVGQTTAPPPGTFHFSSIGLDTADCTGPLPLAPGAPAPVATDSGGTLTVQSITAVDQNNNAGQINCQGTDPLRDSIDLSADAANLAGAFGPSLPDVLSARISVPADALKSGTFTKAFTKAVSNADAPQELPSSCADQFGLPEGQCPMSLNWTGTIKISLPCGVVSSSEGDAPPVGTIVNPGDTVSTGANSRVEITLPDGSVYQLAPNSSMQCDGQTTFAQNPRGIADEFKLLLGHIWAATTSAVGGDHEFVEPAGSEASPGVRGSAFTASIGADGRMFFHVIEGTGFVRIAGRPQFDFPAGEGVSIQGSHYVLTMSWPAADQTLVPVGQLPPGLTRVRLLGARAGNRATLRFRLSENATVTVQIQRGRRRVLNRRAAAWRGTDSIKLTALPRGRYTLTLFANANGRAAAAQLGFHVS